MSVAFVVLNTNFVSFMYNTHIVIASGAHIIRPKTPPPAPPSSFSLFFLIKFTINRSFQTHAATQELERWTKQQLDIPFEDIMVDFLHPHPSVRGALHERS